MILDIRKALAYELHDLVLGLGLGLVNHIILLMIWGHYQVIKFVYGEETLTIFDQRASQLEAY